MTAVPLIDIEPLRSLIAGKPLGLFSDIDGTLSPIVERPEDATVTPRCRELLGRLIEQGVRVALITGRQLDVARSMVGLNEAAYAANHGVEFWVDGSSGFTAVAGEYLPLIDQLDRDAEILAEAGVTIEAKGQGVAFHYRRARDEGMAIARIEAAIRFASAASGFHRIEGRKVIELRPDMKANKGTAAMQLAEQLGVKSIICIGDDRTDVDMFDAVHALRQHGTEGKTVAVVSTEIHPDVLAAADYVVEGVEGVEWLLGELVDAIRQTA